jgi:large subunit ribosomal protein L29
MRIDEIREQTNEELERQIEDLSEELFNLRFRQATQELDNPLRLHHLRKDIARVKTVIRERELGLAGVSRAKKEPSIENQGEPEA